MAGSFRTPVFYGRLRKGPAARKNASLLLMSCRCPHLAPANARKAAPAGAETAREAAGGAGRAGQPHSRRARLRPGNQRLQLGCELAQLLIREEALVVEHGVELVERAHDRVKVLVVLELERNLGSRQRLDAKVGTQCCGDLLVVLDGEALLLAVLDHPIEGCPGELVGRDLPARANSIEPTDH